MRTNRYIVTMECDTYGSATELEVMLRDGMSIRSIEIKAVAVPLSIRDYPREAIMAPEFEDELYRIRIPGLDHNDKPISVPVYEDPDFTEALLNTKLGRLMF